MKKLLLLAALSTTAHAEFVSEMKFKTHNTGDINAGFGWNFQKESVKIVPVLSVGSYDFDSVNAGLTVSVQHKINDFAVENTLGLDLERIKKKTNGNKFWLQTGLSFGFSTDKLNFVGIGNQLRYGFNNKFYVSPVFVMRTAI